MGLSAVAAPAVPPVSPSAPPFDPESILRTCLLPAPPGYNGAAEKHQPQPNPFRLTEAQRARLLSPYAPELIGQTMGWALPDREYRASIPTEAKVIPRDLTSLPVLRFDNLEIHGARELRWRSHGDWDQWFLHDVTRDLDALLTIHRQTRRVYFFEYHWDSDRPVFNAGQETCYSCHVSGPRLVRTCALDKVDTARQAEFNRRLLSYGAADFGASEDPTRLGPALDDARCVRCHNGQTRGRLYAMHVATMAYYTQTLRAMPPGAPLKPEEAQQLIEGQFQRYQAAVGDG